METKQHQHDRTHNRVPLLGKGKANFSSPEAECELELQIPRGNQGSVRIDVETDQSFSAKTEFTLQWNVQGDALDEVSLVAHRQKALESKFSFKAGHFPAFREHADVRPTKSQFLATWRDSQAYPWKATGKFEDLVKSAYSCLRWQNMTDLAEVLSRQADLTRGGENNEKIFLGNLQRNRDDQLSKLRNDVNAHAHGVDFIRTALRSGWEDWVVLALLLMGQNLVSALIADLEWLRSDRRVSQDLRAFADSFLPVESRRGPFLPSSSPLHPPQSDEASYQEGP
jgi:hypothetical protein